MLKSPLERKLLLYTDGGMCKGNGGAAFIALHLQKEKTRKPIVYNGEIWYLLKEIRKSWHFRSTTNNKMELEAAIAALSYYKECPLPNTTPGASNATASASNATASACTLVTDSQYVKVGIANAMTWRNNGWKNTSGTVKNKAEWQRLLALKLSLQQVDRPFEVEWVKGHSGDYWNERVDYLATQASKGTVNVS